MSSTKFIAVMPQSLNPGDIVRIKGLISADADQFSINFVNDTCKTATNITYHFKWIMPNIIVENYKQNGQWVDHKETEYNMFDGRFISLDNPDNSLRNPSQINDSDNDAFKNQYSILGPEFALEFAFQDDTIYVYLINEDEGRNLITSYEPEFELSEIESLQVWGDVDKIKELAFSYN